MNRRKALELIDEGEGLHVEFKQRFSSYEKIAKELISFANTKGGWLFLGVDDDGSIYGIESEKSDLELVKETIEKYCEPPLKYSIDHLELSGKEILIIEIPESQIKPHRLQDYRPELNINSSIVYIRLNDKSVLASKEMIKLMQTQSSGASLKKYEVGKSEKLVFDYLEKHETINVKELSKLGNISERRASRTLIKLVRANLLFIHIKDNGESYFTSSG